MGLFPGSPTERDDLDPIATLKVLRRVVVWRNTPEGATASRAL